jgi:hypothetical protein
VLRDITLTLDICTRELRSHFLIFSKQLTPVERFAVRFFETSGAYVTFEQTEEQVCTVYLYHCGVLY